MRGSGGPVHEDCLEIRGQDEETASLGSNSTGSTTDYFSNTTNVMRIQEAMLEASFDAQFAVNQEGIIRYVNEAAVKQFGYSSKEALVGHNINIIVGGGHASFHDGYLQKFKESRIKLAQLLTLQSERQRSTAS